MSSVDCQLPQKAASQLGPWHDASMLNLHKMHNGNRTVFNVSVFLQKACGDNGTAKEMICG
jgi:hypothetical protein